MKDLTYLVKDILQRNRRARNSDYDLWVEVCKAKCPNALNESFLFVIENHNELGIPKLESVGRIRRKVQELYPELQSDEKIAKERAILEQEFRAYAKGVMN